MPDLIAIAYDDTTTAMAAMDEVHHLAEDLIIQPDAVAAIIRSDDGKYRTVTNQHVVGAGATWGLFWGMLFGLLFFVPVLGMAFGAGLGAVMGKITKSSIDKQFQEQIKDALDARHLCAVPDRRADDRRQGHQGPVEVRWQRHQDLAVRAGRGRAAGSAARRSLLSGPAPTELPIGAGAARRPRPRHAGGA